LFVISVCHSVSPNLKGVAEMNAITENTLLNELDLQSSEALSVHLHDIIHSNLLTAVYQPIVDLSQGK